MPISARAENPGMDSRLDPSTGDYDRTRIADLSNAIYLRLTTPLGTDWADKTLGSKFHLLKRAKDLPRIKKLAQQYAQEALQPLIDTKRADKIDVVVEWAHDGHLRVYGQVYQYDVLLTPFSHFVKVS